MAYTEKAFRDRLKAACGKWNPGRKRGQAIFLGGLKKVCLESFSRESFCTLLHGLTNEGYVIDGREVLGILFSSSQIEHLDQEVFDQLCNSFGVISELQIGSAGKFFDSQGAFYIVYDTCFHDYESAQRTLAKYVDGLPAY